MFNWHKFPDHKPIALRNYFVTIDNAEREIVEAYFSLYFERWCYPHSFGTAVEGTVIAWAEKIRGYNGD